MLSPQFNWSIGRKRVRDGKMSFNMMANDELDDQQKRLVFQYSMMICELGPKGKIHRPPPFF